MKQYSVEIVGVTPYMQHRMDDEKLENWEKNRKLIIEREDISKGDQYRAEFHSYNDEEGFYIPSEHIVSSLINAGALVKSKVGNGKKSMKNIVAGMFSIKEQKIRLPKQYQIDKRSAVNRNMKARIIVIRPKWDEWKAKFTLIVDNDTLTTETIQQIIVYAGQYIGIGSFRPTNNGMFGRFNLSKIKEI